MQTFRRAEPEDIPAILDLLREFYNKQGHIYSGIKFDPASCIETITAVMRDGICLVGDGCCAGAIGVPFPYNRNALFANVVFWYFKRPSGIHIFEALMAECKKAGATHFSAASHFPDRRIERYYQKKGLNVCEGVLMSKL